MNTDIIKKMTFAPTLELYQKAKSLIFPMFPINVNITDRDGNIVRTKTIDEPHLMQRVIVCKVLENRHYANWSDMGTGKTLAAILCAYAIGAKITMVVCPNSVKEEWVSHILAMFPDAEIIDSIRSPVTKPLAFYVVNYEQFQQKWSEIAVANLADSKISFLVFDEIHLAKHRSGNFSERRARLIDLRNRLEKQNPGLHVLGQTGTPCINDGLREPVSLLELVTGNDYSDMPTVASIPNIFRVRQSIIVNGIRCPSIEQSSEPEIIRINCNHRIDDLLDARHSLLTLDRILLTEKIPTILANLKPRKETGKGIIIYMHLVSKLTDLLQAKLRAAGYVVDVYSGIESAETRNEVKHDFIHGSTDVLIASSPIGTGVDGLQKVCDTMIIPILPWTSAEFKQLQARIKRFGQLSDNVRFIIPQAYIEYEGEEWSLDESRWHRILFKQSLGDVLTDGDVPPDAILSVESIKRACLKWLERIKSGKFHEHTRQKIVLEFGERSSIQYNFAEFHQMNSHFNRLHSKKAAEKFQDIELFKKYHQLYEEKSSEWPFLPREVIANWCNDPNDVIGDFGCGAVAHMVDLLPDNVVYSFDHNSLDERVICCDLADVPVEDEQLDVVIFSLSLMGCNYLDYLYEAFRTLSKGGKLFIADLTDHKLVATLAKNLKEIGFQTEKERRWKFTFFKAVKG